MHYKKKKTIFLATIKFNILTKVGYNAEEVVLLAIQRVKDYFNIDDWQINQPISIADIIYELGLVEGVQTVTDVDLENLWDENLGYSGNIYDMAEATRNKVLYPSMDPSIFEIKFPNQDIKGQVTEG